LDWTLMIDGQVDATHLAVKQAIEKTLQRHKPPGRTGLFGSLAFSHQLLHHIGGDIDSNSNTTRRILMLLESSSVGAGSEVRARVLRQLVKRYIEDDFGYRTSGTHQPYVPRFLLNDIVRYWRTLAVDFAAKRRERQGEGWAL